MNARASSPGQERFKGHYAKVALAGPPVMTEASRYNRIVRPRLQGKQRVFRGREIGGCLPKGFMHPPSTPSRYVNYHTLGSPSCATPRRSQP
ncbi:hypothetical protein QJS10_CPA06g00135 [Acorus calamus]|uniref:Uncharacterized protein n=1 Tax=Acorus calamus TaxID=4465 RepID=A0AAV9EN81_ACOCL|nr:hypothetical protein QJS10_CPA06g00135 [Acorus calamus]